MKFRNILKNIYAKIYPSKSDLAKSKSIGSTVELISNGTFCQRQTRRKLVFLGDFVFFSNSKTTKLTVVLCTFYDKYSICRVYFECVYMFVCSNIYMFDFVCVSGENNLRVVSFHANM